MASKSISPRRKMTQAEFLERCRETHGDKYDYSLVKFSNVSTKVTIICPEHGKFKQAPSTHLKGHGCRPCAAACRASKRAMTQEEFLQRCRETHGAVYDYSKTKYTRSFEKVTIICAKHGEFEQTAGKHLHGQGCRKCAREQGIANLTVARSEAEKKGRPWKTKQLFTQDKFLEQAYAVHGGKYDYSRTVYAGSYATVKIICPEHGEFEQKAINHTQGRGCLKCKYAKSSLQNSFSTAQFLERARAAHGDKFDYSKVDYRRGTGKVLIICPTHGEFEQQAKAHMRGDGCRECWLERKAASKTLPEQELLARARAAHGDKYEYSLGEFVGVNTKAKIVCPEHGVFTQLISDHLAGHGCPKCGFSASFNIATSAPEREMRAYIESLGFETEHGYLPNSDSKWTFDVIVPEHKVAFEFNGVYWHSHPRAKRGQHYYKRKHAEESGYRMVTIWEDEWTFKRERMESLIRRALLPVEVRVGARKTEVAKVAREVAAPFHTDYHVQDFKITQASEHYALFDQDDMIAVASFDKKGTLHRYTIMEGVSITGGLLKTIKAYRGDFGPLPIVTYCDRDHFDGKLYAASGFEKVGGTLQMSYVEGPRRVRREKYMKHKLSEVFGADISEGKEIDICAAHGVFAAYNSGVDKYILRN